MLWLGYGLSVSSRVSLPKFNGHCKVLAEVENKSDYGISKWGLGEMIWFKSLGWEKL